MRKRMLQEIFRQSLIHQQQYQIDKHTSTTAASNALGLPCGLIFGAVGFPHLRIFFAIRLICETEH